MAAWEFGIFKTLTTCIKIQASMSSFVETPWLCRKVTCDAPMEHMKHPTTLAFETKLELCPKKRMLEQEQHFSEQAIYAKVLSFSNLGRHWSSRNSPPWRRWQRERCELRHLEGWDTRSRRVDNFGTITWYAKDLLEPKVVATFPSLLELTFKDALLHYRIKWMH